MEREKKTVKIMIEMYCRKHHLPASGLCSECNELLEYAYLRLDKCVFGENKPACARCPIHCYKPTMRKKITSVMKYAGPRMLFKHPILASLHLKDSRKKVQINSFVGKRTVSDKIPNHKSPACAKAPAGRQITGKS